MTSSIPHRWKVAVLTQKSVHFPLPGVEERKGSLQTLFISNIVLKPYLNRFSHILLTFPIAFNQLIQSCTKVFCAKVFSQGAKDQARTQSATTYRSEEEAEGLVLLYFFPHSFGKGVWDHLKCHLTPFSIFSPFELECLELIPLLQLREQITCFFSFLGLLMERNYAPGCMIPRASPIPN